jgi:hypothetical protein
MKDVFRVFESDCAQNVVDQNECDRERAQRIKIGVFHRQIAGYWRLRAT